MASPDSDIIEKLLQSSGLTCDDLIIKLQQYKATQAAKSKTEECPRNLSAAPSEENVSIETNLKTPSDEEDVIPETKRSSVDCDDDATTTVEIVTVLLNDIVEKTVEECINREAARVSNKALSVNDDKISVCSSTNEDNSVTEAIDAFLNETNQSSKQEDDQKPNEKNTFDDEDVSQSKKTCSSIDEHNYSSIIRSSLELDQDFSTSSTEDLYKSEDDLRNTIRMQLSSLRNMKKSNTYLPDLQKKRSIFFHNLKKKRKSVDMNLVTSSKSPLVTSEDGNEEKNELIALSEETNFRIMDVTGGVDRITPTIEDQPSEPIENEERKFAAITESNNETEAKIEDNTLKTSSTSEETEKMIESPRKEIKNILTTYRRKMSLNYFDKNRYKLSSSVTENKPNCITVKKNIAETFAQDPGVSKSVKKSENSPFVSDSLDDFLNESSQLKVSYPIPKLGAEEGIKEGPKESPFDGVVKATTSDTIAGRYTSQKEKPKLIKAKTLADMRRQFEKLKSKNKAGLISKHKDGDTSYKENLKEDSDIKPSTLINSHNISVIPLHRNSFVFCDNKKIWLSSTSRNQCLANLDSRSPSKSTKGSPVKPTSPNEDSPSKKLSLLSCLKENKPCKLRYRAGPLCKKDKLQNLESRNQWTTELKTLPKIYLEVVPEISKPVDFRLVHLLPIFNDPLISEERADFALSVLKPKNQTVETAKSFKFQVPYKNNQEKMVVRKHYKPVVKQNIVINTPNKIDTENIEADVRKVLHDIISYVEVKEIADDLIKDDDVIAQKDDGDLISRKKSRKRKKRLELELLRLNCKVIDVASTMEETKECAKPFCKLGCVCKSLLCDSVFSDHCQLVECMFECKCPPTTVNNMITTTNSLSAQTVTHLDDKVKKNLAKVEREFTQTLIHTDNDVILVGTRGRKRNRTARVPKKYSDFVENIDEFFDDSRKNSGKIVLKPCTVNIPKLNLDSVIPYCLSHNLYNCFCKGEDVSHVKKPANKDKIKSGDNSPSTKKEVKLKFGDNSSFTKVKESKQVKNKSGYNSSSAKVKEDKPSISDDITFPATAKEDKQQQTNISPPSMRQRQVNIYDNTCARTRQIFSEYINRNKDPKYNEKLRLIYRRETARFQMRFERNLKTYNPLEISSTSKSTDDSVLSKKGNKRKQEFSVREDDYQKEFALQRRKRKIKNIENSASDKLYYPIFDGEIKVSLKDNQEMLKIIGEENKFLDYLRILPWPKVIESFCSGKMNIWSKEKPSSALLCNAAGYFPPKYFIDIRRIQQRTDIIDWILTDQLPPDRPRELMHLILTPRKHHFMISGYCLKKTHMSFKSTEFDQSPQHPEFRLSSSVKLEPPDDESEHESLAENQLPHLEKQEQQSFSEENDQPPVLENMVEQPPPEALESSESTVHKILHVPKIIKTEVLELEPVFRKIDLETDNVNNNFRIRPISLSKLLDPKNVATDEPITDKDTFLSKPTTESIEDIPSFIVPKKSAVTSVSEESNLSPKSYITVRRPIPNLKSLKSKSPIKPIAKATVTDKEKSPTFTIPKITEVTSLAAPEHISKPNNQIVRPFRNWKSLKCTSSLQSLTGQDASSTPKRADVDAVSEVLPKPNIKIRFRRAGPGGLNSVISTNRVRTGINEASVKSDGKKLSTFKLFKPVTSLRRKHQLIVAKNVGHQTVMKPITLSPKAKLLESRKKSSQSKTSDNASSSKYVRIISDEVVSDGNVPPQLLKAKSLKFEDPVQAVLSKMRPLRPLPAKTKNVCKIQTAVNEEKSTTSLNVPSDDLNQMVPSTVSAETRNQRLLSISNTVESIARTGELPLVFCLEAVESESTDSVLKGKQNITHPEDVEEIKSKESSVCVPLGSSSPKTPKVADSQIPDSKSNDQESLSILESKTDSSELFSKTWENPQFNTSSRDSFRSDGSGKYASPTASDFGSDADFSFDIDEDIINRLEEPSESSSRVEEASEQKHQLSFPSLLRTESSESSNSNNTELDTIPHNMTANNEKHKETNREEQSVLSPPTPTELQPLSNKGTKGREESSESSQAVEEVSQPTPASVPSLVDAEASKSNSYSDKTQPTLNAEPQAAANETENCPILFKETKKEGQPVLTVVLNADRKPSSQKETKIVSGQKMKCTHRDMDNNSKTLILYTKTFSKRVLCFFDERSNMIKLTTRLPKVNRTCKWRMVFLNSDFTFFKFTKAKYSIKYTDLRDVVKMANNTKLTMLLKNKQFTDCYNHPHFGIYCLSGYSDRLFIGPFYPHEDHEISTFRYLRGKLIDSEVFNSMVGKKVEEKLPVWLYEMPIKSLANPSVSPKNVVIDISDDDDDVCVVNNNTGISIEPIVETTSAGSSNLSRSDDIEEAGEPEDRSIHFPDTFLCYPFITQLTKEELAHKEVNRYMLTNVPHLGYFEAYQRLNKTIEVFWPDGRRGYRFSTVKLAKFSLMFYLTQLLFTIPKSFRLTIVALTDLDKTVYKPISPRYLLRPKSFICCDFGIYAKESVPESVLDRLAIPDVLACIDKEEDEEETEEKMIQIFSLALMSNAEFKKWSKPNDILQWAKTEIYILKKLADNYESEKADLRSMLRTKSLRIQELRVAAPSVSIPAVSLKATAKTTETIEIDDSDDEDHQSTTNANESPKNSPRKGGSSSTPNQTEKRSLLKSNFKVNANLHKITNVEKERYKLSANTSVAESKKRLFQNTLSSKTNGS